MGDVASFPRGLESAGGPPAAAGVRGAVPSTGSPFGVVEGVPSHEILTLDDFTLCSEVSWAFAAASSLLRSGEVKRALAQRPLEELEVRLAAATLQVGSVSYDRRVLCWVLGSLSCLFPSFSSALQHVILMRALGGGGRQALEEARK